MIRGVQFKAARALLGMNQETLAELSHVSKSTIQNIENDEEKCKAASMATLTQIQGALEAKGIKFLFGKDKNDINGIGVRLITEEADQS